jgi:hypothetical protein
MPFESALSLVSDSPLRFGHGNSGLQDHSSAFPRCFAR